MSDKLISDAAPARVLDLSKINSLIIAGWAGRDSAAVEHHIVELEKLGVPRPASVPCFYQLGSHLLSSAPVLEEVGNTASGEVEAVLVFTDGDIFLTVGSDHTDRQLETVGIALSKQVCPKPAAREAWRFDDVKMHWDRIVLRSWALIEGEEVLYQEGRAATNLDPDTLVSLFNTEAGVDGESLPDGSAMFCGTLPAIGGVRPADSFRVEIEDPVLGRRISHSYRCRHLPVAG